MKESLVNIPFDKLRDRAYNIRKSMVENLESHLLTLETQLTNRSITVRWATDDGLCDEVVDLLPESVANRVCLDLDHVSDDFHQRENVMSISTVEDVTNHVQDVDTLVVNADFAISSTGELVFINRKSQHCFNKIRNLIVVVNIDQLVVSPDDLSLFMYLRSRVNGDNVPHDMKIVTNSFKRIEADMFQSTNQKGYTEEDVKISVILYENRVTSILDNTLLRDALFCIRCGKCKEVCPVARMAGGDAPINLIKSCCFNTDKRDNTVFRSTTLCGNCSEVCPVGINFTDLLTHAMSMSYEKKDFFKSGTKSIFGRMYKRAKLNKYNAPFFRIFFVKKLFKKNKMLLDYFKEQKDTFYNIQRKDNQDTTDELF